MKTREEIDGLKSAWRHDPIWDIECTEGFEAHYDELLEYRREVEQVWKDRSNERLMDKAEKLGVPGNTRLAQHIDFLEHKINQLQESILKMQTS
jgi:hypothetical protein